MAYRLVFGLRACAKNNIIKNHLLLNLSTFILYMITFILINQISPIKMLWFESFDKKQQIDFFTLMNLYGLNLLSFD